MLNQYSDSELKRILNKEGSVCAAAKAIGCHHSSINARLKEGKTLTKKDKEKIKKALENHPELSNSKIAKNLSIPAKAKDVKEVRKNMSKGNNSQATPSDPCTTKGYVDLDLDYDKGEGTLTTESPNIKTAEDAMEYAEVDQDKFYIAGQNITFSDVTMGKKNTNTGEPETYRNYHIKVQLKRRKQDSFYNATKELIKEMPSLSEVKTPDYDPEDNLMELCLFDHHFGSLAWKAETGEDYDVRIAQQVFMFAVRQLLDSRRADTVGKILIPIGNDFLHINNEEGKTPKNKNELDTDCRLAKVFKVAQESLIMAIKECAEIAPVEVLWIPGNHDPQTGFYMSCVIEQAFENNPYVTINNDVSPRKYYRHGHTLIGYGHGDEIKDEYLPGLMAEERSDYGECTWKEWHLGHLHKKKETHVTVGNTFNGVKVVHLPSLAGTDYWHFQKGYVKDLRTAEANFYTYDGTPAGYIPAIVPKSMYRQHK